MSEKKYRIEPLNAHHERNDFECGSEPLNRYFKTQASQDVRKRVAACFVAIDLETNTIAGYYTLSSTSISVNDLPETLSRKLPRYPMIPAVLMGRLAVANNKRGLGLGSVLLANALKRAADAEIAAYALVVDSKDQSATAFYEHQGFIRLGESELKLFLPLGSIK